MGNTNCCFLLPNPFRATRHASLFDESFLEGGDSQLDCFLLNHKKEPTKGLTILLTLQQNSKLLQIADWVIAQATPPKAIRNILITTPSNHAASSGQPVWSSLEMQILFQCIGSLPLLEMVLVHEVGTSSNPVPVTGLSRLLRNNPSLRQTYFVGHFQGNVEECDDLASALTEKSKLKSFAMYGNASRDFCLDPILSAVSQLPHLKELYFHANMPNPLSIATLRQVANMPQLESLTIHSCNTSGMNLAYLAQALEQSTCLKDLTVFEAFELFQAKPPTPDSPATPPAKPSSCAPSLYKLVEQSPSLTTVQIWFGFASSSTVLEPFAKALHSNRQIEQFEAALLWTDYTDETAKVFVNMLQENPHIQHLQLGGYKGCWRWILWFWMRLNQNQRQAIEASCETSTRNQWIEVLTSIPPLIPPEPTKKPTSLHTPKRPRSLSETNLAAAALENAPSDPHWFQMSYVYYYLRMNPSLCYSGHGHAVVDDKPDADPCKEAVSEETVSN